MTDKVQKIHEEIERIQLYSQSEVLKKILDFIDSLQEEPVSIWHDASEKPERDDLLIETNDGRIIHRQSINNYGMVKRWAYTSALLNLDNSCNLGNNSQEEPVSEDLEEAMKKTFWESPTFEHPAIAWEDGFRKGAKWQKTTRPIHN